MATLPKRLIPYAFGALTLTAGAFSAVALVPPTAIYAQAGPQAAEHGFFGAGFAVLDNALVLRRVMPDGPAAKAGLQNGDHITSLNGQAVTTPKQAQDLLEALAPNATVSVAYVRNGASASTTVTLGERPERPEGNQPHGTVASVTGSSITITKKDGSTATFAVTASTVYHGYTGLSDVAAGDKIGIRVSPDQPNVAVAVMKHGEHYPPAGAHRGRRGPGGPNGPIGNGAPRTNGA